MFDSSSFSNTFGLDNSMDLSEILRDNTLFDGVADVSDSLPDQLLAGTEADIMWCNNLNVCLHGGLSTHKSDSMEGLGERATASDDPGMSFLVEEKRSWNDFLPIAIQKLKASNPSEDTVQPPERKKVHPSKTLRRSPPVDLPELVHSDPEDSEDSGDEEYTPSQDPMGHRQRRPSAPSRVASRKGRVSSSPSPHPRMRTDKRQRGSPPSRNKQATSDQVEEIRRSLYIDKGGKANLVCPFPGCSYEQLNGRMPDFRRHIKTHIRKDGEVRCKGVPWQDALSFPHRFRNISLHEKPYTIPGESGLWVGGCLKTFSRADALKRHLNHTSCEGYH